MHASLAQRQQSCSKRAFSSESHLSFTSTSFIIIPHPCSSQSQWGLMRPSRPSLPICSKRSRMYLRVFSFEHNYAVCCTSWNLDDCKGTYFKPICRTPKKNKTIHFLAQILPPVFQRSCHTWGSLALCHRKDLQSLQSGATVTKCSASCTCNIWLVDFQLSESKGGSHPVGSHCENLPPSRSPAARLLEESPCFARPSSESLEAFNPQGIFQSVRDNERTPWKDTSPKA